MRLLSDFTVLNLPGRDGSGQDHWQTSWERSFPEIVRVEQANWGTPVYSDWVMNLSKAVQDANKPVLIIAHSAGTSLTMRWSSEYPDLAAKVAGAFLVAPSDRDVMEGLPENPVRGFGPMLLRPLPFPAVVLASQNDPLVAFARAKLFASSWGADFVDAGMNGHLGEAAKLGSWPFGLLVLGQFLHSLR